MYLWVTDEPKESQEGDFTVWIYLSNAFSRYSHAHPSEYWIIAHLENSTIATNTGGYYDSYTITCAWHVVPRENLINTCLLHTDAGELRACSDEFPSLHAVQIHSQYRRYDGPVIIPGGLLGGNFR